MSRSRIFFFFLFFLFFESSLILSQEIYFAKGGSLASYDLATCQFGPEIPLEDLRASFVGLSFHPDGRLYIIPIDQDQIVRYNIPKKEIEGFLPFSNLGPDFSLAVSEEGRTLVSQQLDGMMDNIIILDYNMREGIVTDTIHSDFDNKEEQSGRIRGILNDHQYLLQYMNIMITEEDLFNSYRIWDTSADSVKTFEIPHLVDYYFGLPALFMPPCESAQLIDIGSYDNDRRYELLKIDMEDQKIQEVCEDLFDPEFYDGSTLPLWLVLGLATPTDFRQSPLRIHLDDDMSSGHMTGGYYDTLTTCRKEVPIADEDIELFTCGAAVDSISFRLRYYDQPRLAEEYLTAEADGGTFRQTSPSRWVWKNPYGGDEAQIKDFLRSVRYHADWDPEDAEQSRERVVMTTMYVDGDSTTSWTVYQLEKDEEIYAGRDTVVTYCAEDEFLDLADYLSTGATRDGRIDPALTAGGMIFTPGVDEDTTYLYIVEEGECADTAELQVVPFVAENIHLDTVFLCPGESQMIGFPPDRYEITWWDGSRGDSILISEVDAGSKRVSIQFDDCGIQAEMEIIVRDLSGQAGEEREIFYCEGEAEISLLDSFPEFPGMEGRIEGLPDGIFRPDVDDPGKYAYILSMGICADTATINLTPSADREIFPGEVVLCADETRWIGFATGTYNEIIWENGVQGDSVEITSDQTGPFGFEALRSGCRYYGTFEIVVQPELSFPEIYPDTVRICRGEESRIPVEELDSVWWEGRMYQEGEELVFTEEGDFTLTGYMNGCAAEKEIAVEVISDPAANYHILTELCEGEETEIRLPEETNDLRFEWKDGSAEPVRRVDQPGEYPFSILAGDCVFEGAIEVIERTDCDPVWEDGGSS